MVDDSVEVLGLEASSLSEQNGKRIGSQSRTNQTTSSNSFSFMPNEILVHIFKNIVRLNDRCAIGRVNHHFHTLALPFIYESIRIDSREQHGMKQQHLLNGIIFQKPSLGKLIISLDLHWDWNSMTTISGLWSGEVLRRLLCRVPHLQELILHIHLDPGIFIQKENQFTFNRQTFGDHSMAELRNVVYRNEDTRVQEVALLMFLPSIKKLSISNLWANLASQTLDSYDESWTDAGSPLQSLTLGPLVKPSTALVDLLKKTNLLEELVYDLGMYAAERSASGNLGLMDLLAPVADTVLSLQLSGYHTKALHLETVNLRQFQSLRSLEITQALLFAVDFGRSGIGTTPVRTFGP
jgi:hypothetical protein